MKDMFLLFLALVCASAVLAYPTHVGPTGYVVLPSADVVAQGETNLAADWYDTSDNTTIPVRLVYGVAENAEIGAEYEIDEGDYILGFHGKWQIPIGAGAYKAAIGAVQVYGQGTGWKATQVYLAATRGLTLADARTPATGTIGVNWTRAEDDGVWDADATRFFAALEIGLKDNLSACLEYQTKANAFGWLEPHAMTSIALRCKFKPNLSGQIGFTNADEFFGFYSHTLFVGLNYSYAGGLGR
jgi:hypothetical protein